MVAKYLLPGLCFLSCAALGDIMDDFFPGYANPTRSSWQDNFHFSTSDYTFTMANDAIFGSTDRYFTNGVWGSWSDPLDQYVYLTEDNQVHLIEDEALLQDAEFQRDPLLMFHGMTLGQHMYTPSDIRLRPADASQYDRPYAGYLYVSFDTSLHSSDQVDYHSWAVGCVGPCSGADSKQTWAHEELSPSSPKPRGWSTQVKNQPAIQFARSRYHYQSFSLPFLPQTSGGTFWELEYGSVFNRAGAGVHTVITLAGHRDCSATGYNLPESTGRIPKDRNGGAGAKQQVIKPFCKPYDQHLSLYASAGFKGVLSNTLIEGGIHTDDGVIRHKAAPLFTELKTGLEWQMSDYVAVSASYVVRSPEVDDEGYVWNKHRWGEASLTVRDIGPWGIALTALLLEGIVAYKSGDEDTDD